MRAVERLGTPFPWSRKSMEIRLLCTRASMHPTALEAELDLARLLAAEGTSYAELVPAKPAPPAPRASSPAAQDASTADGSMPDGSARDARDGGVHAAAPAPEDEASDDAGADPRADPAANAASAR